MSEKIVATSIFFIFQLKIVADSIITSLKIVHLYSFKHKHK